MVGFSFFFSHFLHVACSKIPRIMSSNPKRDRENDHDDQEAEFEEGTEVIGKETSNMKGSGSMTTTSGANKKMKSNTGAAVPTSDSIFSLGRCDYF